MIFRPLRERYPTAEGAARFSAQLEAMIRPRPPRIETFDGEHPPFRAPPAERARKIAREALEGPAGVQKCIERAHEYRLKVNIGRNPSRLDELVVHMSKAKPSRLIDRQKRIEGRAVADHGGQSVPRERTLSPMRNRYTARATAECCMK
jgi:hypothetical protein